MKFEIIFMALAFLGIQAGVYQRPIVTPQSLSGTYILTLHDVKDQARGMAQQPIGQRFQGKEGKRNGN